MREADSRLGLRVQRTASETQAPGWLDLPPTGPRHSAGEGSDSDSDHEESQDPDGDEASRAVVHAPTLGSRR